jgi:hypothetical protein
MIRHWLLPALASAACAAAACHRPAGESESRPERPSRTRNDPYLIEGDEIRAATSAQNLYEVIRVRRPAWLTKSVRDVSGDEAVVVYLDDRKLGMLPVLRGLRVDLPERMRYMSPTEAQLRFGPTHGPLAAIVIEIAK